MGKTIAVSGKGGTGKTTISALIIRWLGEHRSHSILAVDADSNVNLNDVLGVQVKDTIGAIREEMMSLASKLPGGMTKQQFLEYKIHSSLAETTNFDLLAMGRPEGPGCYCYANNLLRDILETISSNYEFIVMDNQAGMEHLSRRIAGPIDYLLLVSDPTVRGILTAGKICRLINELETRAPKKFLILNRTSVFLSEVVKKAIVSERLELLGSIPEDDVLLRNAQEGSPIWNVLQDSLAYKAIGQLMAKMLE